MDFGDRGETALDRGQCIGVGQAADADRNIGAQERPRAFNDSRPDGCILRRQSFFS
jgi:hypothetical protein